MIIIEVISIISSILQYLIMIKIKTDNIVNNNIVKVTKYRIFYKK